MKSSLVPAMVLALAVSLATAAAEEKPFSFKIDGNTLHIFAPDGKEVGTGLPPATVGKTVSAPPYSFQVSFGTDANGNLAVIVTPDPEHPAPLNFTLNNQQVHMDSGSVATVTLGSDGNARVEGGLTGGVNVDNHPAPSPSALAANGSAPAAPAAPTAPSAALAQATPAGTLPASVNSPLGSLTPDAVASTGLPQAGQVNTSAVAAEVVNNPQVVASSTVAVSSDIVVVNTPQGTGLASSQNPNSVVTLQAVTQALVSNAGASQSISGSSSGSGVAVTTTSSSGVTVTTTPPSTTPF